MKTEIDKIVEENFKGLGDLIEDRELFHFYKGVIKNILDGYSKDVMYWKERCRLAEAIMSKPPLLHFTQLQFVEDKEAYNKFITDNGKKEY